MAGRCLACVPESAPAQTEGDEEVAHEADLPKRERGLYGKFFVSRVDGKDAPGEKHDGCEYFVLDRTHDKYAAAALAAYANACEAEYPALAADLRRATPRDATPSESSAQPVAEWQYKYHDGYWRVSNGREINGSRGIEMSDLKVWECKVGEVAELAKGADFPMRQAVRAAYIELTGEEPRFLFSGWGADLTENERAVVEDREPIVREVNNDEVICPACVHQFRAVPVNVQAELTSLRAALAKAEKQRDAAYAAALDRAAHRIELMRITPTDVILCADTIDACAAAIRSMRDCAKG